MNKAYLTIDDGPTKNTRAIIDFLNSKGITPIMFFCEGDQGHSLVRKPLIIIKT